MGVDGRLFRSAQHHRQYIMSQLPECMNAFALVRAVAHFTHNIVGGMGGIINDPEFIQDKE
jgi:hypothetical protein